MSVKHSDWSGSSTPIDVISLNRCWENVREREPTSFFRCWGPERQPIRIAVSESRQGQDRIHRFDHTPWRRD